jgi:uncharacterized repeat protein (TIGR03803 family)
MTTSMSLRLVGRYALFVIAAVIGASNTSRAQTFQVIHTFTGGRDGFWPYAGLTLGPGGQLYGAASDFAGPGSVFQMKNKNGVWLFSTLLTFDEDDGAVPLGRPVFGPGGALYGTTYEYGRGGSGCGDEGCGVVYSLRPGRTICQTVSCPWSAVLAYSFTGGQDGGQPFYVDPVFDSEGNLYGTTLEGGSYGLGTVFRLSRANGGWTESVILNFDGGNGYAPLSGVILDNLGNVYGTTENNV